MSNQNRIMLSFVNSFTYLYKDAVFLHDLAKSDVHKENFSRTKLCRSAVVFYILSLEGLANRSMDHFLPNQSRDFFLAREQNMSLLDKWELLPTFVNSDATSEFDKSSYPWTHLTELIKIRNDCIHPKHDRVVFYKVTGKGLIEDLPFNEIPDGLTYEDKRGKRKPVVEKDLVYRLHRIPRDPYSILPEHVDIIKKTVDDIVAELDRLLEGKLTEGGWLTQDKMTLIYPPGATVEDDVLPK